MWLKKDLPVYQLLLLIIFIIGIVAVIVLLKNKNLFRFGLQLQPVQVVGDSLQDLMYIQL